jgi:hypothetical protein
MELAMASPSERRTGSGQDNRSTRRRDDKTTPKVFGAVRWQTFNAEQDRRQRSEVREQMRAQNRESRIENREP